MANRSYSYIGTGDKNDIPLSYEEYNEMLDVLRDDKFSKEGLLRMKNLFEVNSYGQIYVPFYLLPPALLLTYALTGRVKRSHSGYRYFFPTLSVIWPLTCWWGYTTPIPRRLYTQILTDPGEDGEYIRAAIQNHKPGLWRRISRRLADGGYSFQQMNEYLKGTNFPTDFVN